MCGDMPSYQQSIYLNVKERPDVEIGDTVTFLVKGKVTQITEREAHAGSTHNDKGYECSVTVEEPDVTLKKAGSPSYGSGIGSQKKE